MLNHATKHGRSTARPWGFGGPSGADPREAGRAGGLKSGESRRLRPLTDLEQKVLASRNGQAAYQLLRLKREDEAELLEARRQADAAFARTMDMVDEEREVLDKLRAERYAVHVEIDELRERLESDDGVVEWLRVIGEERAERCARVLGWIED